MDLFSFKAQEKNIDLIFSVDENIPETLIGDPLRISQILNNLVGNAIKFTNTGNVEISISIDQIDISDEKVSLQFFIKDTGIGILLF